MQCGNRLAIARIALALPFAVLGPGMALAQAACEAETADLVTLARGVQLDITAPADCGQGVSCVWRGGPRRALPRKYQPSR